MSAIGVGVSDRDVVHGWESITPDHRSAAEIAYLEARDDADTLWGRFTQFVDSWIAVGNYEALDKAQAEAEAADRKAAMLYRQMNCSHKHTTQTGGMHFSGGDVWDDISEYCLDCGAGL